MESGVFWISGQLRSERLSSSWAEPKTLSDSLTQFRDDGMRTPEGEPPDLWHEDDPLPEGSLTLELDGHGVDVDPAVLRDLRYVAKGDSHFREIV